MVFRFRNDERLYHVEREGTATLQQILHRLRTIAHTHRERQIVEAEIVKRFTSKDHTPTPVPDVDLEALVALFALMGPDPDQLQEQCWSLVDAILAQQADNAEDKAVRERLDNAYPFGRKDGKPFQVWQKVVEHTLKMRFTGL